jgi:hypothetical protein
LLGLANGDSLGDKLRAANVGSAVGLELGASDGDSRGLADSNSLGDELGAADDNDVVG